MGTAWDAVHTRVHTCSCGALHPASVLVRGNAQLHEWKRLARPLVSADQASWNRVILPRRMAVCGHVHVTDVHVSIPKPRRELGHHIRIWGRKPHTHTKKIRTRRPGREVTSFLFEAAVSTLWEEVLGFQYCNSQLCFVLLTTDP